MLRALRSAGILAGLALAAAVPSTAQSRATWSSSEIGLQVTSPGGWGIVLQTTREAVFAPAYGGGKIAVFSLPLATEEDDPPDLRKLADSAVESLRTSFKKFKLLGEREVEVAGRPALEIYFSGRRDEGKIRSVQTLLAYRGNQVILMYMAPDDEYTRTLGDYDQTLRSVRWLASE